MKLPHARRSQSRGAARALDILEYFGEVGRPLRAIEIARALELQPSSTSQLLKTLVDAAHLVFDARTKMYLPSPRLTKFGAWVAATYGGDARFQVLLTELHAATGAIVTLTTPNDLFMQVVDMAGALPPESHAGRGLLVSLFGSAAIGAAYLSVLSDKQVEELAMRARLHSRLVPDIIRRIREARDDGFAQGDSVGGEFASIAIPLPRAVAPVPLVVGLADDRGRVQCNQVALRGHMLRAIDRLVAT
jgi:DNA-binding IclR family transcriptional regulator